MCAAGSRGAVAALVTAFFVCGSAASGAGEPVPPGHRLSMAESYTIPVAELSALALIAQSPSQLTALMAGDAGYRLARLVQRQGTEIPVIETMDVADLLGAHRSEPSQWEAIAADGQDNPCLLAEVSAEVRCLDRDLNQLLASFQLDVSTIPSLDKSWQAEPNSRGEGMILLRHGHLLLLKEKKPSLLVEFGPKGEEAIGYGEDSFLKPGEVFAYPPKGRLDALKVWAFADSLGKLARDGSDIALGPDGRVYLLSDESAALIRLEGRLKPSEDTVRESARWALPKAIIKPEGLAIDRDMRPWIAVDRKREDRPALFRLSPITPP